MSHDKDGGKTILGYLKGFFSSISLNVKLICGAIISVFAFFSVFLFAKGLNQKKILKLELKKIREKIEIERAQEEIDENSGILISLEKEEASIMERLRVLDAETPREQISKEELDEFFDDRGF